MARLAETDPEFYQYLAKNDQQLLEFSGDEEDEVPTDGDDDMGRPEPVPPSVTSRSEVCFSIFFIRSGFLRWCVCVCVCVCVCECVCVCGGGVSSKCSMKFF